ncbi:MAG: hypothetical protein CV045_12710, partial [Cyanobacteria bacterium M5B4]
MSSPSRRGIPGFTDHLEILSRSVLPVNGQNKTLCTAPRTERAINEVGASYRFPLPLSMKNDRDEMENILQKNVPPCMMKRGKTTDRRDFMLPKQIITNKTQNFKNLIQTALLRSGLTQTTIAKVEEWLPDTAISWGGEVSYPLVEEMGWDAPSRGQYWQPHKARENIEEFAFRNADGSLWQIMMPSASDDR